MKQTIGVSIHAHRGFSAKYPENTLLAFEKAIEAKADYIELDVHASSDKQVVVIHDRTTWRVSSQLINIEKSTLEQIQGVKLRKNQKVPTLREVCQLCAGKIGLNIEIKQKGITSLINDIIREFGMESEVMISSFHHNELQIMQKLNPTLLFATLEPNGETLIQHILNAFRKRNFIKNALLVKARGINPFFLHISPSFCARAHDNGLSVVPWTIKNPKIWDRLVAAGVDGIITNDPKALYEYLQGRAANS